MIYSFGITITAFLIVLLLFKSNKSAADKILLLWFFFAFIHQLLTYFAVSGIYNTKFSFLIGTNLPLPLIHPPFLFLYVSNLTKTSPKNKITTLLHFLPATVFYVYLFNFFKLPVEQKIYVMSHKGAGFEVAVFIKFVAIIASGLVYIIWSLYKIKKYQQNIKNVFSNTEKINLEWLKILTYGIGIIWIAILFRNDIETSIVISLFTLVIGFFGIRQVPIFSTIPNTSNPLQVTESKTMPEPLKLEISEPPEHKKEMLKTALPQQIDDNKFFLNPDTQLDILTTEIKSNPKDVSQYIAEFSNEIKTIAEPVKYENSVLSDDKKEILKTALQQQIDGNKLFLNPDLSLDILATEIKSHPNYVSQYINEFLGFTFYDYINSKRIEEFKRQLSLPESKNLSLLGIAFNCGFNSKSSFNRNFKKFTGQTPTEYLNAAKNMGTN